MMDYHITVGIRKLDVFVTDIQMVDHSKTNLFCQVFKCQSITGLFLSSSQMPYEKPDHLRAHQLSPIRKPDVSGLQIPTEYNLNTVRIWNPDFLMVGFSYRYSRNHSKTECFCPEFKCILTKWHVNHLQHNLFLTIHYPD